MKKGEFRGCERKSYVRIRLGKRAGMGKMEAIVDQVGIQFIEGHKSRLDRMETGAARGSIKRRLKN
jgi:hypothetical protein